MSFRTVFGDGLHSEAVGFVRAWLEVMGPELALLGGFIGLILYITRMRPGRRPDATPHSSAYDDSSAMGGGDFG